MHDFITAYKLPFTPTHTANGIAVMLQTEAAKIFTLRSKEEYAMVRYATGVCAILPVSILIPIPKPKDAA